MMRYSILKAPFLLALNLSCLSLLSYKSMAISWPLFSIKDAMCKVLPPAPAQVSTTRIPGFTSRKAATNWEEASWTSNNPSLKASVKNTLALSLRTKASGWSFKNSVSMFKSIKMARSFSLVVFRVFTLRITCACLFCAAISLVQTSSPNSLTPNSSIQSGMDSRIFLILDNSSKRPLIFRSGVPSNCRQSGIG